MPTIMPIRDLRNTSEISEIAHKIQEPIFITKNGYSDLVVMSAELYERFAQINRIDQAIYEAEAEVAEGAAPISLNDAKARLDGNYYIDSIYAYIALEKLAPENEKSQTDRIWAAIESLDSFPSAHQDRQVGKYAGRGYKQLLIDNYMAIFKIDEQNKTVYVVTVQYQGRNI